MPQCFGLTPCTTTWMCSTAAPLDSCRAWVSASMILGTESSVTRWSYSLTSIQGMAPPSSPFDVLGAPVGAQHEVAPAIGHVVERNRRQGFEETNAPLLGDCVPHPPVDH